MITITFGWTRRFAFQKYSLLLVSCFVESAISANEIHDLTCALQTTNQVVLDQKERAHAPHSEDPEALSREYHLVPHHKSGWIMSKQAHVYMREALANLSSVPPIQLEFSARTMGLAMDRSMMLTRNPSCIAQFSRNPFEMVVSGYLYHMAESESWLTLKKFGQAAPDCEPRFVDGRLSARCKEPSTKLYWMRKAQGGIAEVFHSTRSGPIADHLPDALAGETFPQYLKRIDLDAGLLAEYVWALNRSLKPMSFTKDFAISHACSVNVCFHEFYDNCKATWQRVMKAWEIQPPRYDAMLRAATKSCPGISWDTKLHSSAHLAKKKKLAHIPESEMVKRLRVLDRTVLNGKLSALETHLACPLSGKYKAV